MVFLELFMQSTQVPTRIRREECTRIITLFTVTEQCAVKTPYTLIPRQLAKGFRLRYANQFGGFGACLLYTSDAADE